MNVLRTLVEFVRADAVSLRESHTHPHTGLIDEPEVLAEIVEMETAVQLAEAALAALGIE